MNERSIVLTSILFVMQGEVKRILITGASGFIGRYLVHYALAQGLDVYAGVRSSSNRSRLPTERIGFVEVDFDKPGNLHAELARFSEETGGFHYVIHNAGVTKPRHPGEFEQGNAAFARHFAETLLKTQPGLRKFVYMSSLAALGPGDPDSLAPITELQSPRPITPYGKSKLLGEQLLFELDGLPLVVIRPSAVYGPGDAKFLERLMRIFNRGLEVRVGARDQRLSFIYVGDLASVSIEACLSDNSNEAFNISDGGNYSLAEFNSYVKEAIGARTVPLHIPSGLLMTYGYLSFLGLTALGKPVHLSHFKVRELTAKNWIVDISKARERLGFEPEFPLPVGIRKAVEIIAENKKGAR